MFNKEKVVKLGRAIYNRTVEKVTNYSTFQAEEALRAEFKKLLGTDKPTVRDVRLHDRELFAIMEEVLDVALEGVTETAFFNQFVEYRNINRGDSKEFYVEDRTMLTVSEIADGHLSLRRQRLNTGDSFTVKTKVFGASVYADFIEYITGRVDFAFLISKIEEAFRLKIAEDIYTAFLGASAYLPAEFKKTGSFVKAELDELIAKVRVANKYAPVVIAGTKNALNKINDGTYGGSSNFLLSDRMKDDLNRQGIVDMWYGTPMLEIPQVFIRETFDFKLDDTKILILPANVKPIKFVWGGEGFIRQTSGGGNGDNMPSNRDMSMEYVYTTLYGIATIFNTAYGAWDNLA